MSLFATVLSEVEHTLAPLIMPPLAFAGIAFAVFLVLGVVTFTYRDVYNRHLPKKSADSHDSHAGH